MVRTTSAGRAIATVLVALSMAALLCADSLVQVAERQPFGARRDLALDVTHVLQDVSHAVGLHLPRRWLAEATGNADLPTSASGGPLVVPSAVAVDPSTTRPGRSDGTDGTDGGGTAPGGGEVAAPPTTAPPTTTTTLPARRVPTAEDPVRVAMMGDSIMGQVSQGLGRLLRGDPRVAIHADVQVSTGLARPDVLDWPRYLSEQLPAVGAEVVFLSFGGNDDQDMQRADGVRVTLLSPEWQAEYAARVALAMDVAAQGDRSVVWLGLPAEEPERLQGAKDVMNAIAREQAALRPRVEFLDIGSVLTPSGAYSDTFTFADGTTIRVRERDGVHYSVGGGDVLAPTVLSSFAAEWHLTDPAAAPPG